MKPDQERVKSLLLDTVSLLCKNSLLYQAELRVEGVIGITVDKNDVFIVHINENYKGSATEVAPEISAIERENDQIRSHQILVSSQSPVRNDEMVPSPGLKNSRSIHRRPGQGSRRRSRDSPVDLKSVKTEKAEEAGIVIIDSKERLSAAGVTDDGELMRQGYPAAAAYENIGLDNIQAAISQYEQITNLSGNAIETATGEPAAKHRRLAQHVVAAQTDATSPFVTGVAARTAVEHALPPGWNSVTVPAGNAETSPGCSSWPGGAQVNADMIMGKYDERVRLKKVLSSHLKLPIVTPPKGLNHIKRDVLYTKIVQPIMKKKCRVYAWRVVWHTKSADEDLWRNILVHRTQCEDVIKLLDGIGMFISAVMATTSNFKMGKTRVYTMHPGLAFWVVTNDDDEFDAKDIPEKLASKCESALVEPIGKGLIKGEDDLLNTLSLVLKHDKNEEIKHRIISKLPEIVDVSEIEGGLASRVIITDIKEFDEIGDNVANDVDLNLLVER